MPLSLAELNQVDQPTFTHALAWVFEDAAWVAEQAWSASPFATVAALHGAMVQAVQAASAERQLALILAYPDLGTRVHASPVSQQEHAGAGLDHLTPQEYEQFLALNAAYRTRFGFPFIMAVRGQEKSAVLAAMDQRLAESPETERARALREIGAIAAFRLADAVTE